MIKIGLTGGIGSGKSSVASLFADLGVPVISADDIAHQLTRAGSPQLDEIARHFGDSVLQSDGNLDRRQLADLVFADPLKKKLLEDILHPVIRTAMHKQADSSNAPYVILEIPLLLESGQYREMDRVLVVNAPLQARKRWLANDRGIDQQQVERIIRQQASNAERLAIADDVIENSAGLDDLASQVAQLHRRYLADCSSRRL